MNFTIKNEQIEQFNESESKCLKYLMSDANIYVGDMLVWSTFSTDDINLGLSHIRFSQDRRANDPAHWVKQKRPTFTVNRFA